MTGKNTERDDAPRTRTAEEVGQGHKSGQTGPAQPHDVDQPESDALTWRDKDGHVHKTRRAERLAAEAEKARGDRQRTVVPLGRPMPPD